MKPDKAGIWEWFDEVGTKRLCFVCDTNEKLREATGHAEPALEVYWWGGYYSIEDRHEPGHPEWDNQLKAEWPDRWGNYLGPAWSFPDEQLYLMPTPEQLDKLGKEGKL